MLFLTLFGFVLLLFLFLFLFVCSGLFIYLFISSYSFWFLSIMKDASRASRAALSSVLLSRYFHQHKSSVQITSSHFVLFLHFVTITLWYRCLKGGWRGWKENARTWMWRTLNAIPRLGDFPLSLPPSNSFPLKLLSLFKIRGITSHFFHLSPIWRGLDQEAREERSIHSFSRSFVRSFVRPSLPSSLHQSIHLSIHPSIHPFIQRVVKLWNLNVNGAGIGSAWR